ncbi:MAG: amylo-alpha-1,6-glucosidase [Janthinobacterium lividum]
MTQLSGDILQHWDTSSSREWLITNGIGGYASSSLSGANTRRYHGLLVPAFSPPLGRAVLLSKAEEEIRVEDQLYQLSANKYPSVVQPQGFRHLTYFSTRPVPTFTFIFHEETVVLEKRIWMAHGLNTVYIQYTLVKSPEPVKLGIVPLLAYKDYHTEQHRWDGFTAELTHEADGRLKFVAFPTANPLFMTMKPPFGFVDHSGWFFNFEHPREQERGLDFTEDLYCPGRFSGILSPGQTITLIATVETETPEEPEIALTQEIARQKALLETAGVKPGDTAHETLTLAADQFVIENSEKVARATIMAGYPWFTDWGRDTMISLPGLCLTTKRFSVAKEILSAFAGAVHNGLLPNRFSDNGTGAEYNTVDASLWFFQAIYAYAEASGDWQFAQTEMLPVLQTILKAHIDGTDYNIGVDPADGLLHAGQPGVQLTWMDAKVGDWVVTPRIGKPVEINALWHNALCVAAEIADRAGQAPFAADCRTRAAQAKDSFWHLFWNPATHSLFDVIGSDGQPDASLRPNQIFAVSLPFPVIDGERAKSVVDVVASQLLTPFGLRTLAPGSPDYHPHYAPGDQTARDGAYHQGTVWAWLLGAFCEAHFKAYGDKAKTRGLLADLLKTGLTEYGIGTLAEICDADSPYAPNGCPAQAWSVAEVLRVYALLN